MATTASDSLRNIVSDPRVGLLFLIPGTGEALRVNGTATISTDPALLDRFAMEGKLPESSLVIAVETVFFQSASRHPARGLVGGAAQARPVPTAGAILQGLTDAAIDGTAYDRELPTRQSQSLY